jgi:FHIPEP family/Effector-associated domain 1
VYGSGTVADIGGIVSILDSSDFSTRDPEAHRLLDVLVDAYKTKAAIVALIDLAGIQQADVNLDGATRDAWLDVLRVAARSSRLRPLVETAADDGAVAAYRQQLQSFLDTRIEPAATKDEALTQEVAVALASVGRCRSPILIALETEDEPLAELEWSRTTCHLTITLSEDQVKSAEVIVRDALASETSIAEIVDAGGRIWDVLLAAEPRLSALLERIAGARLSQPVAWCGRPELLGRMETALLLTHVGGDDVDGFLCVGTGGHYVMPIQSTRDARTMRQRSPSPHPTVTVIDLRTERAEQRQAKLREAATNDIVVGVDSGTETPMLLAFGEVIKAEPNFPTRAIVAFGLAPDAWTMSQLLDSVPCVSVADADVAESALLTVLEKALSEHAERLPLPCIVSAVRAAWIRWAISHRDVDACRRGLTWSTWSCIGLPLFAKRYSEVVPASYPHLMDLRAVASEDWYFNRRKNIVDVYQADQLARPFQPREERFHLYLSGAGGTGKSCFLRYIHDQIAPRSHSIAVWYRVDAPSSSWENVEDRIREETVNAVMTKAGEDTAKRVSRISGGLGVFLLETAQLLEDREPRFDGITVFIDQLERTFESGDEPDPHRLDTISNQLVQLLRDVGVGNGVRVFVASRKQYLPDFLGSYRTAKECRLEFNVLQTIADETERVEFVRRVLDWCRKEQLVTPRVTIREEAATSLAEHTRGNPLNMMLALIQLLSENLTGPVTKEDVSRYRPWDRLFALDLQAAARDDLDWHFLLAMSHARTEIVSFEEVLWRLRMVDQRLTRRVNHLRPPGILERLWLLGFLGRTIYARPYGDEPGRFVEFFHANLRDYLLREVMAHGGADLGFGGRRGGTPPAWRALDRLAVYARDWAQTQQLLPAEDVRVLMEHREAVLEKYQVFDEPEPSPPFYLLFLRDRRNARKELSKAAQECFVFSALVHDDGGRSTFQELFRDVDDQTELCSYWLSRCSADTRPAILRYLIPMETAKARKLVRDLVLDSTSPPREEMAQAIADILAEPMYAARWRNEVLTAVLSEALRRVDGEVGRLSRHATSFLAAACDWDRDAVVSVISYSIERLGISTDPDLRGLAVQLAEHADVDRWLTATDAEAGFRTVSVSQTRADAATSPVELVLGSKLREAVDAAKLSAWTRELRDLLGVPMPDIQLFHGEVKDDEAELRLQGTRVSRNVFYPDLVSVPKRRWDVLGKPPPPEAIQNYDRAEEEVLWVPLPVLTSTHYRSTVRDFDEMVVRWLEYHCRRTFDLLFDGELLMALAREALSTPGGRRRLQGIPIRQLRQVVVDLVEEGVPFGSRRDVMLEELAQLVQRVQQPELLTQKVREYLRADICRSVVDDSGQVTTILLDLQLEEALANRVMVGGGRQVLILNPPDAIKLDAAVQRHVKLIVEKEDGPAPVLITVPALRQSLARLLHRFDPFLPVLSFTELEPDLIPVPGGMVNITLDLETAE